MAFITGTAANHTALWNTLLDFLQNNTALVAAGQNWTKVWELSGQPELMLKGPGLAGGDEVYVGIKRTDNTLTNGESLIWITGATGITTGATSFTGHVNSLTRTPAIFLDQNPMQYWMVANGRRFVVVVKISTVYQAMYGGLFLPYSNPAAYPYPLFVGGTRGFSGYSATYITNSWRQSEVDWYRHFAYARSSNGSTNWYDSAACMLTPDAQWGQGTIDATVAVYSNPRFMLGPRAFPDYLGARNLTETVNGNYQSSGNQVRFGYSLVRSKMTAGLNGEFPLTPITLMAANNGPLPNPVTYGVLHGVYSVPGLGNVAENLVTIGGVNHLVVPNVQRTTETEYWALALE